METKKRNCWLFVLDGYSGWEPALAVAGLNVFDLLILPGGNPWDEGKNANWRCAK
jgi:hypothetical protein